LARTLCGSVLQHSFLLSVFQAWRFRNAPVLTLRWITRAIAILLGIATTRPVMGVFFATTRATHLSPEQFFGMHSGLASQSIH
jgi:hypothetical protein